MSGRLDNGVFEKLLILGWSCVGVADGTIDRMMLNVVPDTAAAMSRPIILQVRLPEKPVISRKSQAMVNVEKTPFGEYAFVVGGGPGNYTGYGSKVFHVSSDSPDTYHPQQSKVPNNEGIGNQSYRARLLQTTNLGNDSKNLPKINNISYHARGLIHQGQQRQRATRLYHFPEIKNWSPARSSSSKSHRTRSNSDRCKTSSEVRQKAATVLPDVTKRTAGISTLDTVFYRGFAKGVAAARADSCSLVNALRGEKETFVHHADKDSGKIASIPDSEENLTVLPHGYENFYYTALELLKRKRLNETYIATFQDHRKKRSQITKRKIYKADKVKQQHLHADQLTASLLGLKREPIHIPTATMESEDDYAEFCLKSKTLKSVEQTRKNISSAYLNVWNSRLRQPGGD